MANADDQEPKPAPPADTAYAAVRPTVLLIDDNRDMLTLLSDTLSGEFSCLSANNGEDGLKLALAHIPDIIICDVMMPGLSGFDVA